MRNLMFLTQTDGCLLRMAASDAITLWLSLLREGHPEAAQRIWDRYFRRLVGLARKKLRGRRLAVADEEDVAISALDSFCRNAREGRFPQLADSDGLWRLLVVITARKAVRLVRDQGRQKRSGGRGTLTGPLDSQGNQPAVEELIGNEPSPEFAARVAEEYERLLGLLDDDQRAIAIAKLEGLTNEQIAARLNRALRTVERRLKLIRKIWTEREAI
jgi:DNA-directed RNA polymerase specialized sigma24 family protein